MADNQSPELFGQTPWQTVGPYFHLRLPWRGGADLIGGSQAGAPELMPPGQLQREPAASSATSGRRIEIVGRVLDGQAAPVPDALLEIWQANAAGRYVCAADPRGELPLEAGFSGFGRAASAPDGSFRFLTIMPGRVPDPHGALQGPHLAVGVLGRGLLKRLVTRIYFEGEAGNDTDPILALVPPRRRGTLIARRIAQAPGGAPASYRFDVRLQGEGETVFFAY
ncbi:MAG TPA: protocatechuate 3,4-dioxygenase subunit alpha [Steroidobacteraceae bacterium]|nr:protocatechuate 3,4-dioxygenase subunit alpha [Steroidobacteraceae bacterium]